jgi:hypothetical protein
MKYFPSESIEIINTQTATKSTCPKFTGSFFSTTHNDSELSSVNSNISEQPNKRIFLLEMPNCRPIDNLTDKHLALVRFNVNFLKGSALTNMPLNLALQ